MSNNGKTITFTLSDPVDFNGVVVTDLTFRPPTTGDLVSCDAFDGPNAKSMALLAGMADVTIPFMKKVSLVDFVAMTEAVAPFMPAALVPDGLTSSL